MPSGSGEGALQAALGIGGEELLGSEGTAALLGLLRPQGARALEEAAAATAAANQAASAAGSGDAGRGGADGEAAGHDYEALLARLAAVKAKAAAAEAAGLSDPMEADDPFSAMEADRVAPAVGEAAIVLTPHLLSRLNHLLKVEEGIAAEWRRPFATHLLRLCGLTSGLT